MTSSSSTKQSRKSFQASGERRASASICLSSSRGERHQQLEAIGIGIASVNACASFPGKMFAQERGEVLGKLGQAVTPRCNVSPASDICAISSGVDWRYQ